MISLRKRLNNGVNCTPTKGCPVEVTLSIIGGKWKGIILYELLGGTKRFQELRRALPTATQKMLTLQLRELEADGLIHREVHHLVPPKVEYSLTPLGASLESILTQMKAWGERFQAEHHLSDFQT
ncbi:winged helix-turn-helix transcriptional regulator [Paenibacillus polymyxa]|jgi:DNA-binding HxlR family transcriptional regulator|uniref:winged helix-turn-helix transcriptional regulator n=1 Tax=Paenibacillus TaxID=44249 RepID=UPI000A2F46D7|nr:helix-turn-helix transcriptional regulator [Paenibacillus sp. EKM101P]KAF6622784.1 helix-turn-helix transcriptional regulator [Paenibacillus sp. EKM102P]KAF6632636.1 helix-turn-helix transcriptional regulator [Paenibacillus sp. EKM10P]KAF6647388.1 helix-turn-helix transcriptional regulator [Paenibacillus sp. EKM11P]KAF6657188.1 helix-turn-helix transcriptional regulator [Paenibacillus sp. EKM301P]MBE3646120.1 helix-turn-helix transcriptional regulator [Paenibacillus polymyxa]